MHDAPVSKVEEDSPIEADDNNDKQYWHNDLVDWFNGGHSTRHREASS